MRRFGWVLSVSLVAAVFFLGGSAPQASAHEHVQVGEYEFTLGWTNEPPIVGQPNGLDLGIENGTGAPVTGAHQTLSATLSHHDASMTGVLRSQFGRPGWYTFDVIPTQEGVYAVHVVGTVGNTSVDITVDLAEVSPRGEIEFPTPDPTPTDLQQGIDSVRGQAVILLVVTAVALIFGLIGTALGVVAWRSKKPGG